MTGRMSFFPFAPSDKNQMIPASAVSLLCDFLEVSFHMIMYVRQLYPPTLFERRQKYGIPVQMSRHPDLNRYLSDVIDHLRPWLVKGHVNRVAMVIMTPPRGNPGDHADDLGVAVVERFVVELDFLLTSVASGELPKLNQAEIEIQLRSFLLKIAICDSLLSPLPDGCTFTICALTKDAVDLFEGEEERKHWVPADPVVVDSLTTKTHTKMDAAKPSHIAEAVTLVPLKSSHLGDFRMQLFVEESTTKKLPVQ